MVVLAKSDLAAGILNAAIGIGLALALWDHTSVELLLVAIVLACITSNRVYSRLYERRRGLEALHEFTKTVVRSIDMSQIASSVLGGRPLLAQRRRRRAADRVRGPGRSGPAVHAGFRPAAARNASRWSSSTRDLARRHPRRDAAPVRGRAACHRPGSGTRTSVAALAAPITRANGSVFGALVVTQARRKAASRFGDDHAAAAGIPGRPGVHGHRERAAVPWCWSWRRPSGPTRRCTTR